MLRRLYPFFVVTLLVAACAGGETEHTESVSSPEDAVQNWLDGLADLDLAMIEGATDGPNVALVAGAENGFSVEQMEAVVDSGLPAATSRSYWSTLRAGLLAFLGGGVDEVTILRVEEFEVDGIPFAAVVVGRDGLESEIIVQQGPDGWFVDLIATAGPPLAVQIRRLIDAIVDAGDDDAAHDYAIMAVTSLGAALVRDPDNRALELELEAIEDLPVDLSR